MHVVVRSADGPQPGKQDEDDDIVEGGRGGVPPRKRPSLATSDAREIAS